MSRSRTGSLKLRAGGFHLRVTSDVDGKTKREWYDLDTFDPKVAEAKRARLVEALARGQGPSRQEVAGVGTVEDFGTAWLKERKALGVVSARDEDNNLTRHVYAIVLEDKRRFGDVKVTDVRPPQIRTVLMAAVAEGLAKGTVKHIRAVMNRLFGAAWQNEVIPENPVLKAKLPKMREVKKERVVLTDEEIVQFVSFAKVDHELRVVSICARCEGGMRTGDINTWDWTMIARPSFATCVVPRSKTETPQEMAIPEPLRPVLRAWWEQHGSPASGPVFPARRGKNAGGFKAKRGISYAKRLRTALLRADVKRHVCARPAAEGEGSLLPGARVGPDLQGDRVHAAGRLSLVPAGVQLGAGPGRRQLCSTR